MSTVEEKKRLAEVFPDSPHRPSLSAAINASTKDLHDSVNVLLVQRFSLGLRDYRLYREGILSFYYVYLAFEETWASLLASPSSVDPHVYAAIQAIADPRLTRAPSFAADLAYFYGPDNFDPTSPASTEERSKYVRHIQKTLREKPHLVLAYAHSYYMALFAGGKMLCRQLLAAKDFFPVRAPAGDYDEAKAYGTNMFVFPVEKGKEEQLREKFKAAMAVIEGTLSEQEWTEIIQESRTIFQMNERLVRELDDICETLDIPAAPLVLAKEPSPAGRYKVLLAVFAVAALWCVRRCFRS